MVFLARQGLRLDREQFARVTPALRSQWAALGVKVVITHDYDDAAQALRELQGLHAADYVPPSERTRRLWLTHVEQFDRLQQDYSDALHEDLAILRLQFSDMGNLTLWIADDRGQLARWAANDRRYRSPDELRRIRAGFDSDWIAGACLGRNEMLVESVPDRSATDRWTTVAATPLVARLPGGPDLPCGVISAAATTTFGDDEADRVNEIFAELSVKWSEVIAAVVAGTS